MVVSTKVEPIDRDLIIRLVGSPQERSAMFAEFARDKLAEAEDQNETVLGRVPPHQTYVDGVAGASEDSVRPDGVILYEFEITSDALIWIGQQLQLHSPVGSVGDLHPGLYRSSHTLFADGAEIQIGADVPAAAEYVFINSQPYARKIDKGSSPQFPDGVYQSIAALARARFGNVVKVSYEFRAFRGGAVSAWASKTKLPHKGHANAKTRMDWLTRQPCIVVTPR